MKRLYLAIADHIIGATRVMAVLIIPCAFSQQFARVMVVIAVTLDMLTMCGKMKGWNHENS